MIDSLPQKEEGGRVIYLPVFSWDEVNDASQQNNKKEVKPQEVGNGLNLLGQFRLLWRGLERKKLCEVNFRDSIEPEEAAEPRQKVGAGEREAEILKKQTLLQLLVCVYTYIFFWTRCDREVRDALGDSLRSLFGL